MIAFAAIAIAAILAQPVFSKPSLLVNGVAGAAWDGLKVTFGINPFDPNDFASLPRTTAEAKTDGWNADISVTCTGGGAFRGNRYIYKNGDTSAMVLFDKNGYIAGIQAGIPKNISAGYPAPDFFKTWTEEKNTWTITAYFVDPSTICSTGRSAEQFEQEGTGTSLIIQNGPDAEKDQTVIPLQESSLTGTQWTKGKCFYFMGMHYWYNLRKDMPAAEFYPVFLQYNKGLLNGFGWAFGADIKNGRYEHPPKATFGSFMQDPPTFLENLPFNPTTLHVYMTSDPRLNFC